MSNNIRINEIPSGERPREKLLFYGAQFLSNEELLAIILRTGNKDSNVVELSYRIIHSVGGLNGLFKASAKELMKVKGVKEAKATQILAMCELYKRFKVSELTQVKISKPSDVAELVLDELRMLRQEVLILITLDTKNKVISKKEIFRGGLNSSLVHPREIFREAVKDSAASIIICHNHPSGDPTPSRDDINITTRLKECGKMMGIELLDHLIIGDNRFISLKEKDIL
ncbi:RadC family protein [Clostridium perfringens]|uniref:RadC family protein n=1 Tax=Clostridium perfringens TaxID=1502 RepID=UPI001C8473C5|nr:DNA repair protein RadC [Clostridium perfringens]MCI2777771.1 DNA repair protein RadC [Clostridium perfringens]MDK0696172.1 DNA repair protein RadC [Clostridium perfringens]